ncbi:hypothetical protein FSS13T_18380 [Flavobacterium saliperosum S13]|nr:hypothetical protein FSS13T_18380 [Flavobacterium saliperosum S13]
MGSVMSLMTENEISGSNLSDLPSLLKGSGEGIGSKLLDLLFGDKSSSVTDFISGIGGIRNSSAGALLGMLGPMILGHFSKSGLSSSGLTDLLLSEKNNILSETPRGLSGVLGFADGYKHEAKSPVNPVSGGNAGGGLPKWLLPLLLVGVALLALYFFTQQSNKEVKTDPDSEYIADSLDVGMDSLGAEFEDATIEIDKALGDFLKFKLPNGVELNAPEFGIEYRLVEWMNDKNKLVDKTTWFNFDRLLFETGKSTLRPESKDQLENISTIMDAYPTMEIKLGGYTDNVGDPAANLKLSDERAKSVMAELVKLGVKSERITAEGYGEQHAIASNETEQGRASNRRIAIRVTKKIN